MTRLTVLFAYLFFALPAFAQAPTVEDLDNAMVACVENPQPGCNITSLQKRKDALLKREWRKDGAKGAFEARNSIKRLANYPNLQTIQAMTAAEPSEQGETIEELPEGAVTHHRAIIGGIDFEVSYQERPPGPADQLTGWTLPEDETGPAALVVESATFNELEAENDAKNFVRVLVILARNGATSGDRSTYVNRSARVDEFFAEQSLGMLEHRGLEDRTGGTDVVGWFDAPDGDYQLCKTQRSGPNLMGTVADHLGIPPTQVNRTQDIYQKYDIVTTIWGKRPICNDPADEWYGRAMNSNAERTWTKNYTTGEWVFKMGRIDCLFGCSRHTWQHEVYHIYKALHDGREICTTTAVTGCTCSGVACGYGNRISTQGNNSSAVMGPGGWQRSRVVWTRKGDPMPRVDWSTRQTITENGVYRITPADRGGETLMMNFNDGSNYKYSVDMRVSQGNSPFPTDWSIWLYKVKPDGNTRIVDWTPATGSQADGNMREGRVYEDPEREISWLVEEINETEGWADVRVTFGLECVASDPRLALKPAEATAEPGASATFRVEATNNDSTSCEARTVTLTASGPEGWTFEPAVQELTIPPGATRRTDLVVTPSTRDLAEYEIAVSDGTRTVTAKLVIAIKPVVQITGPDTVKHRETLRFKAESTGKEVSFSFNGAHQCTDRSGDNGLFACNGTPAPRKGVYTAVARTPGGDPSSMSVRVQKKGGKSRRK